jgi:hypothetical protein
MALRAFNVKMTVVFDDKQHELTPEFINDEIVGTLDQHYFDEFSEEMVTEIETVELDDHEADGHVDYAIESAEEYRRTWGTEELVG